jgi:hypothetical protein
MLDFNGNVQTKQPIENCANGTQVQAQRSVSHASLFQVVEVVVHIIFPEMYEPDWPDMLQESRDDPRVFCCSRGGVALHKKRVTEVAGYVDSGLQLGGGALRRGGAWFEARHKQCLNRPKKHLPNEMSCPETREVSTYSCLHLSVSLCL